MFEDIKRIRQELYDACESKDQIDMLGAINNLDTFIYKNQDKLKM